MDPNANLRERIVSALTRKLIVELRKPRILRDHAYEADIVVARMIVQQPYNAPIALSLK